MNRTSRIAAGAVALAASAGILAWSLLGRSATVPLLRADSKDLEFTTVVPCPEVPLLETRNFLWSASFPLAWDALRRDVLAGAPVDLKAPACRSAMAALNANPFPPGDLDPSCCVAMAGDVRTGIEGRVRDALRGRADMDIPPLGPEDFLAFGFLEKDMPFETHFENIKGGIPFGAEGRRVRAFGLPDGSSNPLKAALLAQVRIHLAEAEGGEVQGVHPLPDRFVVELVPEGGRDRILLAQVKPKATLAETWEAVRLASAGPGQPSPSDTVLAVPKMNFDIDHSFSEFEGARGNIGLLRYARQRTRFRLDETGARFHSTGTIGGSKSVAPTFEFRRPFLLALQQQGATRPYLLLWVGNTELLSPE